MFLFHCYISSLIYFMIFTLSNCISISLLQALMYSIFNQFCCCVLQLFHSHPPSIHCCISLSIYFIFTTRSCQVVFLSYLFVCYTPKLASPMVYHVECDATLKNIMAYFPRYNYKDCLFSVMALSMTEEGSSNTRSNTNLYISSR